MTIPGPGFYTIGPLAVTGQSVPFRVIALWFGLFPGAIAILPLAPVKVLVFFLRISDDLCSSGAIELKDVLCQVATCGFLSFILGLVASAVAENRKKSRRLCFLVPI